MTSKITILQEIIAHKHIEVAAAKERISLEELERSFAEFGPSRPFAGALAQRIQSKQPAVIAEIKKASPSKGLIREDFDPARIAIDYAQAGATCLSVLTDEKYFQGSTRYLQEARAVCELPVIRKDFMIDAYQVAQAKAMGADCILLIVAALEKSLLHELADYANEVSLDVLVEINSAEELNTALELDTALIGINNRNLHTFETSLDVTLQLARSVPEDRVVITESGIHSAADVQRMLEQGIFGFLIGETFMRAPSPGMKLKEIFYGTS